MLGLDRSLPLQKDKPEAALPLRFHSLAYAIQLVSFPLQVPGLLRGLALQSGPSGGRRLSEPATVRRVSSNWTYYSEGQIGSIGNCPGGDGGVIQ